MAYPGTRKRVTFTIRDLAGTLTDPTGVVIKYRRIGDTITTKTYGSDAEVVKESAGIYHIDIDCAKDGEYAARCITSGTLVGAIEEKWQVLRTAFD